MGGSDNVVLLRPYFILYIFTIHMFTMFTAEVTGYNVEQETEYGFISVYDGELQECHIPNLTRSTRYKFRVSNVILSCHVTS